MRSPAGPDNFVLIHCLEMAWDEREVKERKVIYILLFPPSDDNCKKLID